MKKKFIISIISLSISFLSIGSVFGSFKYSKSSPKEINTTIDKTIQKFQYDNLPPDSFDDGYKEVDKIVTSNKKGGLNNDNDSGFVYGAVNGGLFKARISRGYIGSMDPWNNIDYGISQEYSFIITTKGELPDNNEKGWIDPLYMYITKENINSKNINDIISPVYRIIYAKESSDGEYKAVQYEEGYSPVTKYETTLYSSIKGFGYYNHREVWKEI